MTYTLTLPNEKLAILIDKYKDYQVIDYNKYTLFRAKIKSTALTIYKTGKVLLQGNDCNDVYQEICKMFDLDCVLSNDKPLNQELHIHVGKSIIGTDEVGTGDYFGGIVVCASLVPTDKILELTQMGIKDSKQISDKQIMILGKYLIDNIDHTVLLLNDEKYNKVISQGKANLNKIKAVLHNKVINNFLKKYPDTKYDNIIIDGFCSYEKYEDYLKNIKSFNKDAQLIEKAENKFISVAASSIIARYYFLKHLEDLSKKTGYELIKGASSRVDNLARKIIKEKGIDFLYSIAKMNFKNTKKAQGDQYE